MNNLERVQSYLRGVVCRADDEDIARDMIITLAAMKNDAVIQNDQAMAKLIWCYEQILNIQQNFVSAFWQMKSGNFYQSWCLLERVEIVLHWLERHFSLVDEYKLCYIKKYTSQFQALFPYKLFLSPAYFKLEVLCSVCQKPISIRNSCGHEVGEIYDGEMCSREITKAKLLEISLTPSPRQKYSVAFIYDSGAEQGTDSYKYALVHYVVNGLISPFNDWEMQWTKMRHPHSRYSDVGRDEPCPCESGRKYKNCCLLEIGVLRPHLQIFFSVPPPSGLASFEYVD